MPNRHFPVRPNLEQLRHQAKELLSAIRREEPTAVAELQEHLSEVTPAKAKLAQVQFVLARSYGLASWPRLVTACHLIDAIWRDDAARARDLVLKHPRLLREAARGTVTCNWGAPLSYAANLGRTGIVEMLHEMGAEDVQHAFDRACLQGKLDTAQRLRTLGARLVPGLVMGPCETLSGTGLAFLLDMGAELADEKGDRLAPIGLILETYTRNPEGKHRCLETVAEHGFVLPDTPVMALHRGRVDLLEKHLSHDRHLLSRRFTHHEIYPLELGCHKDKTLALHGTPLAGDTLLHLAVDFDEVEIVHWLLGQGVDVNVGAEVDIDGFSGHTALFGCVVSQPYRCGRQKDGSMARLLLNHGADPTIRASLRKELRFVSDETLHEYRDVTALEWGHRFHDQDWVCPAALRMLTEK